MWTSRRSPAPDQVSRASSPSSLKAMGEKELHRLHGTGKLLPGARGLCAHLPSGKWLPMKIFFTAWGPVTHCDDRLFFERAVHVHPWGLTLDFGVKQLFLEASRQ